MTQKWLRGWFLFFNFKVICSLYINSGLNTGLGGGLFNNNSTLGGTGLGLGQTNANSLMPG